MKRVGWGCVMYGKDLHQGVFPRFFEYMYLTTKLTFYVILTEKVFLNNGRNG